ncbi:MAG: archease [Candidatus Thorarchaeota archaeon]
MQRGFRLHDHTADITIECWAPTIEESFEEAAHATFEVILDTSTVRALEFVDIEVEGVDIKELLVEWIGRLISLIDINYQFYSKFEIIELKEDNGRYSLKGRTWGEEINHSRHDTRTEVKAMTYADLKIIQEPEKTIIWFTLDL